MYENAANATDGIRGRPVHFEIHDDRALPGYLKAVIAEGLSTKRLHDYFLVG
jgi:hypothetical protein